MLVSDINQGHKMTNTNQNPNRNPNRNRTYSKAGPAAKSTFSEKRTKPTTTVYVGNLSYTKNESDIKKMFRKFGVVKFVNIILDSKTKKSKGIAFVQMPSKSQAADAVAKLDGSLQDGRTVKVSIAEEREEFKTGNYRNSPESDEDEIPKKARKKKATSGLDSLFTYLNK